MALSPDGRWLAYASNTTGSLEVWVQAFRGPENPVRVSSRGGVEPAWARDGRELYYLEGNKLMAAGVDAGPEFNFTAPAPLFEYRISAAANLRHMTLDRTGVFSSSRRRMLHPRPLL
jgi:eukaryotic-like serine/threonine-protein kinase